MDKEHLKKLAVILAEAVCAVLALVLLWRVIRSIAIILAVCFLILAGRNLFEYLSGGNGPKE